MLRVSPTFRLSISASLMMASLLLLADLVGLVPDNRLAVMQARQRICESLAVQLSIAATRADAELVKQTLDVFAERSPDVLSAALRRVKGEIFSETPNHSKYWVAPADDHSTFTHVIVPVFAGDTRWGSVEVSFVGINPGWFGWIRNSVWGMVIFITLLGLGAFYLVLRRALRELDPRGTIPQRIRSAFDALAEGVLILDNRGFIALANIAFAGKIGRKVDDLIGLEASHLEWRGNDGQSKPDILPWTKTLNSGGSTVRVLMRLAGGAKQETQSFVVNSAPILDDRRQPRGAIVTFDNVTALEKKNEELKRTIGLLEDSEREIKNKNEELNRLAARDPLSGCLNRRAFFATLDPLYAKVESEGMVLSCLMLDIDLFKTVNDRFGHDVGDKVIKWVAETIQSNVGDSGFVCRYGGEEFCVVLPSLGVFQANGVAQQIRRSIEENASVRFGRELQVTISIGLSSVHFGAKTAADLVTQADQALYTAKAAGRNRVVRWSAEVGTQVSLKPSTRQRARIVDVSADAPAVPLSTPEGDEPRRDDGGGLVTGLTERLEFAEWIEQAMRGGNPDARKVAVLSLVPNQFRRVSDTLGPAIGDALLTVMSQRLHETLRSFETPAESNDGRPRSLVSRLGIDELAIALTAVSNKDSVQRVLTSILRVMSQPLEIRGHTVQIDVSIGVAMTPEGGDKPEELLKNAATARHYAHDQHRNERYAFYSFEMNMSSMRRVRIVSELQQALDNNQFVLNYQPQRDVKTGEIVAWEALLRWSHPDLGFVLPSELIPIAEQTGLINGLGRWVLRASCQQAKAWSDAGLGAPRIAVNISAVQLQQSDIVTQVSDALTETGLEPSRLELEITESAIMHDQAFAQRTLAQLRSLGITVAIDDFGTGYSGLSYMKDLPVDVVKIDRSFLTNVQADARAAKLYGAIVDMARSLNLYVIAEGIEAQEDLDFVTSAGCNAIQGYLFNAPMVSTQVELLLRGRPASPERDDRSDRAVG
jgi:diguanylate cyclase (GGDEF)-like protein